MTSMNYKSKGGKSAKSRKDKGTGGKACWEGYKRVGANGCTKMKKGGK